MNKFQNAMLAAKPLLPPSRWMACQVGFRAGWIAGLTEAKRATRASGFADELSDRVLDELIDDANAQAHQTPGATAEGGMVPPVVGTSGRKDGDA
jgi:hypothetical protein